MVLQIPYAPESGRGDSSSREAPARSFISKLYSSVTKGLPFAEPVPALRADEADVVRGILQMLQGFTSSLFYWDGDSRQFVMKNGLYMSHLSYRSFYNFLDPFLQAANCLNLVEILVDEVDSSKEVPPTVRAFCGCVSTWLKRLRDIALKKEEEVVGGTSESSTTILSLVNSLSSICRGSELLLQIVHEAIPNRFFDGSISIQSNEFAVHILDTLYMKLNEVCLVQGGEDEAYHMLLTTFSGTLLPYLEGLDSWLYDGSLDDPYNELFFYADNIVSIDQPEFWEKSYIVKSRKCKKYGHSVSLLNNNAEFQIHDKKSPIDKIPGLTTVSPKGKDHDNMLDVVCPLFLKDTAKAIVSAGKSLQLVRHVWDDCIFSNSDDSVHKSNPVVASTYCASSDPISVRKYKVGGDPQCSNSLDAESNVSNADRSYSGWEGQMKRHHHNQGVRMLTLPELFLISLVGLIEEGEHICKHFTDALLCSQEISRLCKSYIEYLKLKGENTENVPQKNCGSWFKFIISTIVEKGRWPDLQKEFSSTSGHENELSRSDEIDDNHILKEMEDIIDTCGNEYLRNGSFKLDGGNYYAFYPQNPVITVCKDFLNRDKTYLEDLNISNKFLLPPLNDESLRTAIFDENLTDISLGSDISSVGMPPRLNGTDFNLGFRSCQLERTRQRFVASTLESMYPFPTVLPYYQEDLGVSDLIPFQRNSTLASGILKRLNTIAPKYTPLPTIIVQKCLVTYIRKQVDFIGKHILFKFMGDWKLMEELGILRSIYLLGSGDLLQQFLISIFNKLDKGDSWDDDFELNTLLQQSIRNSADGAVFSAPDSLVVSITKYDDSEVEDDDSGNGFTPHKTQASAFGIDSLDLLRFTYKVSWPLDLIINSDAIKKYNQVMGFLLKVKRAKFVLDKTRMWMWKSRGNLSSTRKHHLLVEQKLLHFVDAFHQYVMDRVYHSAWLELCNSMATAGSLDEIIQVHEVYLASIQRQCFVAPDKLWALIASRVKIILGLALDFYSIQKTLASGGAAPAIKARCEMEVDRVERQFDDCIALLIRILSYKINVGHFPHLADLVTRINYNHFYMSESGNLLTTPSFELASSRLSQGRQNMSNS